MSVAIYEETKKDIDEAYRNKNSSKIEKETSFILNQLIVSMLSLFKERVVGISIERLDFKEDYVFSEKNWKSLYSWLNRSQELVFPLTDLDFGKLKIDFEYWYYQLGGKEINFVYPEDYLLKPSQVAKQLGVSNVTVNKYIKQGLECIDTTNHHKIPKHAVEIWKDPVYAIKMQMLAQEKKLKKQTPEERINEINEELLDFQKKYKAKTYQEAFNGSDWDMMDIDALDDPSDYYEWRDLEEEKESLIMKLIGDKNRVEQ